MPGVSWIANNWGMKGRRVHLVRRTTRRIRRTASVCAKTQEPQGWSRNIDLSIGGGYLFAGLKVIGMTRREREENYAAREKLIPPFPREPRALGTEKARKGNGNGREDNIGEARNKSKSSAAPPKSDAPHFHPPTTPARNLTLRYFIKLNLPPAAPIYNPFTTYIADFISKNKW